MKAVVITHSSTFEGRADAVGHFLEKRGYEVIRVFSDFDHHRKKTLSRKKPGYVYLHMTPYSKNLSARRLFAIHSFARKVVKHLEERIEAGEKIDLVYILLPANSFVPAAERLRRKYHFRLVYDIIDLWPESLPLKGLSGLPPIRFWSRLRDGEIGNADHIFTECSLYRTILQSLPEKKTDTLYWYKKDTEKWKPEKESDFRIGRPEKCKEQRTDAADKGTEAAVSEAAERGTRLRLIYMGAVNNIIHISMIADLLRALHAKIPTELVVIGEGERTEEFLLAVRETGVSVDYRGPIYDEKEKNDLLRSADLGLNLMRPEVKVGLTMKSIDYLYCGLPLISNIQGDTEKLIRTERIGVHIEDPASEQTAEAVLAAAQDPDMRRRARSAYEQYFTEKHFENVLQQMLEG
ncbi:MAG: glycosyltransferase [Eubacteriales bacterium]|nr:glycosyltransferase [Eubacteriales bacterium]